MKTTLDLVGVTGVKQARELWTGQDLGEITDRMEQVLPPHGAVLVKLY